MRWGLQTPPASLWNDFRKNECQVYELSQEISPLFFAERAVEVWNSGLYGGADAFDTVAYSGIVPNRPWRPRRAILTAFNEVDVPEGKRTVTREARIFELKLQPKRESLLVYAAWVPLAKHGLVPDSMPALDRGKKLYQQFNFIDPTDEDYAFVKAQLSRGASGTFSVPVTNS